MHQAVTQAQLYLAEGYGWVIDLDLEKFFDRVNHDKLMGRIAKRVEHKRLSKLIRDVLERRGDGERVSQSKRGRDSARGPSHSAYTKGNFDRLGRRNLCFGANPKESECCDEW